MNDNSNEPIKDTKHLFKTLNINENTLTDAQKESIRENGYLVIHPTKSILANLKKLNDEANKLIALEGDKGGWEGKEKFYEKGKYFEDGSDRLGNLINKHEIFRTFKNLILLYFKK